MPPTGLLPHAHQTAVRLGAWMPFERAAREVEAILGVQVSDSLVRQQTLQAGAIAMQIQEEQARPSGSLRFALPQEEAGQRMAISSDGAMVPLRGGVWGEVKTVVIGQVLAQAPAAQDSARTTAHSSFSRLADAATFADLASVEIARRGVERAEAVCAVQDGAQWLQSFVQSHRADAIRILDFAHAAGYLGTIREQMQQAGHRLPRGWLDVLLHQLKHHGPRRVVAHLRRFKGWVKVPALEETLRYFGKRLAQMQYPQFQAAGWPIGSGMVESANKLVMQARLKGAGMHWEPSNVNPMLALRDALCNDRWSESWQQQQQWRREARRDRRTYRSHRRRLHLEHQLSQQIIGLWLRTPPPQPQPHPMPPPGQTDGQKQWGRQTFSCKALLSQNAKK